MEIIYVNRAGGDQIICINNCCGIMDFINIRRDDKWECTNKGRAYYKCGCTSKRRAYHKCGCDNKRRAYYNNELFISNTKIQWAV